MSAQTYANHKRYVLGFHGITFGFLVVALAWSVAQVVRAPTVGTAVQAMAILGVFGVFFYARAFALQVQNRVIRLEERLRMARVLPEDLAARANDLTVGQLVALRFAPDDELPGLVRRVLAGELTDLDAIKRAIKVWRPDYLRA
jgi:hypothetical protein